MKSRIADSPLQLIPLSKLKKSPRNARRMPHASSQIEALADSIEVHGLIQNLVVQTEIDEKQQPTGFYLVTAGEGRRLAQLLRVKRKRIKAGELIRCVIDNTRDAVSISLAENEMRQRMHPADQFDAFKRLIDGGQSIEDVAAQFGVTPLTVQRRLKLANVCPEVIAVYREGGASLEQLMALAVSDDHEKQLAIWNSTKKYEREPDQLRQRLTEGEVATKTPIARFVGIKAYLKAGGAIRKDLFSDDEGGFISDVDLLNRLAQEKLDREAKKLAAEGFAWVQTFAKLTYDQRAEYGRVRMVEREPDADERKKLDALEARETELDALLVEVDSEDARAEELANEAEQVRDAIDEIQESLSVPYADEQAVAGALVSISADGKLWIDRGVLKPEDAARLRKTHKGKEEDGEAKAPRIHSAPLLRRLTAHRTMALRATLAEQPAIALAAVTERLVLEVFFGRGTAWDSAVQITPQFFDLKAHVPEMEDTPAYVAMAKRREQLRSELPHDSDALLQWLITQPLERQLSLLAFCVALTVQGVQSDEGESVLEGLAQATRLDMKQWWAATAGSYLGAVPRARVLDVVREAISAEAASALKELKKGPLATAAELRLAGTGWLPSILRTQAM